MKAIAAMSARPLLAPLLTARCWALIGCAELCFTRGAAYSFVRDTRDNPPPGLSSLSMGWLQVYGVAWAFSAVLCVYLALSQRRSVWAMTFVGAPALVWALAYGVTWVTKADTSWVGALFFQGISAAIYWIAQVRPPGGWRE